LGSQSTPNAYWSLFNSFSIVGFAIYSKYLLVTLDVSGGENITNATGLGKSDANIVGRAFGRAEMIAGGVQMRMCITPFPGGVQVRMRNLHLLLAAYK
jgi:hypothetical protein